MLSLGQLVSFLLRLCVYWSLFWDWRMMIAFLFQGQQHCSSEGGERGYLLSTAAVTNIEIASSVSLSQNMVPFSISISFFFLLMHPSQKLRGKIVHTGQSSLGIRTVSASLKAGAQNWITYWKKREGKISMSEWIAWGRDRFHQDISRCELRMQENKKGSRMDREKILADLNQNVHLIMHLRADFVFVCRSKKSGEAVEVPPFHPETDEDKRAFNYFEGVRKVLPSFSRNIFFLVEAVGVSFSHVELVSVFRWKILLLAFIFPLISRKERSLAQMAGRTASYRCSAWIPLLRYHWNSSSTTEPHTPYFSFCLEYTTPQITNHQQKNIWIPNIREHFFTKEQGDWLNQQNAILLAEQMIQDAHPHLLLPNFRKSNTMFISQTKVFLFFYPSLVHLRVRAVSL